MYPELWNAKPKLLHHHNPYDIDKQKWNELYDAVSVTNSEQHTMIPYSYLIPQGIDLDFYTFNSDYTKEKTVNMVAGRIEGKKGVKEVAVACKELGYKFILVGRPSDRNYLDEVLKLGDFIEYHENVTDYELRDLYYRSAIHVCNSLDNFESGTMPILEAMACGVPVLTRSIGHVPDINNGENMQVRQGQPEDMEDLKAYLKTMMENEPMRERIRQKAWDTIKNKPAQKMARQHSQLIYKVLKDKCGKPLVSVIVPTCNRYDNLPKILAGISTQDYPLLEVVICDNSDIKESLAKEIGISIRKSVGLPVKYIWFDRHEEYALAKARNLGAIEAQGEFLVFLDDRLIPEPDAVSEFIKNAYDNVWLWGVKDEAEKGFVENFSCVNRGAFFRHGMFNERIDKYGGLTQETRSRFEANGILPSYITTAKATTSIRSKSKDSKRKDIIEAKYIVWKMLNSV